MKTLLIVFLITINTTFIFSKNFEDLVERGDHYYEKWELQNALAEYRQAYAIDPDNYYLLLKLTRVYNDLGEYYYELNDDKSSEEVVYEGVKYAEKFALLYPDSSKVYSYLAWSYGNQALFEGGNEKIKLAQKIMYNSNEAIRIDSTDYLPYLILGIFNRHIAALSWLEEMFANTFFGEVPEGSFEESERMMLKTLELEPRIVIAAFHLSLTYQEMGEEEKEIAMLKRVVELPERTFRDKFAKRKAGERLMELQS